MSKIYKMNQDKAFSILNIRHAHSELKLSCDLLHQCNNQLIKFYTASCKNLPDHTGVIISGSNDHAKIENMFLLYRDTYFMLFKKLLDTIARYILLHHQDIEECNSNKFLFKWDDIPGNDEDILTKFINQHFAIEWVKTAKFKQFDNGRTIKCYNDNRFFLLNLNDEKTKAHLKIDDGRTHEFIVITKNNTQKIYDNSFWEKNITFDGLYHCKETKEGYNNLKNLIAIEQIIDYRNKLVHTNHFSTMVKCHNNKPRIMLPDNPIAAPYEYKYTKNDTLTFCNDNFQKLTKFYDILLDFKYNSFDNIINQLKTVIE